MKESDMIQVRAHTERDAMLDGVLFSKNPLAVQSESKRNPLLIAITGIHGNFYSNPFYLNIGQMLSEHNFDFLYAQTNDAFPQIESISTHTGQKQIIGSWNERFEYTDQDIEAWLQFARIHGYTRIVLAGHSLGANKVIYYLSNHPDAPIEHFVIMSPANLDYMTSVVTGSQKQIILEMMKQNKGAFILPFELLGWIQCIAATACDWVFSDILNNVHTDELADFSQAEKVRFTGALIIGTRDSFTDGDPVRFLELLNSHMPYAKENEMIFIEGTGHTYQQKHHEIALILLNLMEKWFTA